MLYCFMVQQGYFVYNSGVLSQICAVYLNSDTVQNWTAYTTLHIFLCNLLHNDTYDFLQYSLTP